MPVILLTPSRRLNYIGDSIFYGQIVGNSQFNIVQKISKRSSSAEIQALSYGFLFKGGILYCLVTMQAKRIEDSNRAKHWQKISLAKQNQTTAENFFGQTKPNNSRKFLQPNRTKQQQKLSASTLHAEHSGIRS
jgi:hypothetical protein